jgi:HAE1 family hydrophobic/amphiphilic exporter-1
VTALLCVGVILSSIPLFRRAKSEFVPTDVDEAEFQVNVSAPEGASMEAMDAAMAAVEREVQAVPGVRTVLSTVGGGFLGQVNTGRIHVAIAPHEERTFSLSRLWDATLAGKPADAWKGNYTQSDVMGAINDRLRRLAPLRCSVRNYPSFNIGGGSWDLDFTIQGPSLEELQRYSEAIRKEAIEAGGFRGRDTTIRLDKPELRVDIDRERAADLGLRARDVGSALRVLVGGEEEVSRFRDPLEGEDYDVRLRLEEDDRNRPDILDVLVIPRPGAAPVELSAVARIAPANAPSRIDRLDRRRMVSIRGGVAPGFALGDAVAKIRELADEQDMPPAYTTRLLGRSLEMERTFGEFIWAFVLSFVFMYLILASQFESLVHPLTILVSLPLSVPFALLSLEWGGGALNLFSALGILVLFGVVKKNAILQIDHTNGLRAKGMPRDQAILQANHDRLRPILMTTLALVAGMLPLALGTGPGSEERKSVAIVVIGGQSLCLLLTLLATPVVYSLFDDLQAKLRRKRAPEDRAPPHGGSPAETPAPPREPVAPPPPRERVEATE